MESRGEVAGMAITWDEHPGEETKKATASAGAVADIAVGSVFH